ncbi:MAG TPA: CPBP family intramembrane glutamic endopeptidase [Planctomycetota bacterium]|nr:CPBP family intramembrane glutamic endopeptidase [Planctomycetota bacterium]
MSEPHVEVTAIRESPLHPGVQLERRLPPFYASFFYAFPAAVSWIWLYFQRPSLSRQLWMPSAWMRDLGLGIAAGLAVVGICMLFSRLFAWTRRLEAEFGWILGAQKGWEIVWIALLSGCAEEYLFRGALQQKFGIWVAVVVFAVIHWPLNPNFLPWPFVAGVIGLGLGGLAATTGSLVAPAAAHVVINLINLKRITRRFAVWDEARANRYVDTGKTS